MTERIVVLVRHARHDEVGRVLSGRSEIALNAAGRREAGAVARDLADRGYMSLHASPRARAVQTASAIAERTGLTMRTTPALDEIGFGAFTGRSFAALEEDAAWRRWNAERDTARCPGGETMGEAVARAARYLRALTPEQCPALCVTHCDIIRGLVAAARGEGYGVIYAIGCDTASQTTLAIASDGTMRVLAINKAPRPVRS